MTNYQPGDIVDVTIKRVRVAHESPVGLLTIVDEHGGLFPMPPQAAIERVAPEVRPGDLWHDRHGIAWFGVLKDGDLLLSNSNLTRHHPADVNTQFGPMALVHRESGDES